MSEILEEQVQKILDRMDDQDNQEPQTQNTPQPDEIQDIYVLIIREREEEKAQVVNSTPTAPQKVSMIPAYVICCFYIFLIVSILAFQVYALLNPPIVTVSIIPKSQTVTMTGTLQLGRALQPLTLTQSQTVPTTGHGHQEAKAATGFITFYNGQFQSVTIASGTILTGSSGIQIITSQDAVIPAGNPPSYGQFSVLAHAISIGARGNIPAYDINQACCATSVLAKNTRVFTGGQDERDYQFVTKGDITNTEAALKATVAEGSSAALQGQLRNNEYLVTLSCSTTTTADHHAGEEAATVKVMVSETCSAVAYNSQQLESMVTQLLTAQAAKKLGSDYHLLGSTQIAVTSAAVSKQVTLSFTSASTWVYALSSAEQKNIKKIIAGKTKQKALQLLLSLPGIESASIVSSGFADDTRLPKDTFYVHFQLLIGSSGNLPESTIAEFSFEDV